MVWLRFLFYLKWHIWFDFGLKFHQAKVNWATLIKYTSKSYSHFLFLLIIQVFLLNIFVKQLLYITIVWLLWGKLFHNFLLSNLDLLVPILKQAASLPIYCECVFITHYQWLMRIVKGSFSVSFHVEVFLRIRKEECKLREGMWRTLPLQSRKMREVVQPSSICSLFMF